MSSRRFSDRETRPGLGKRGQSFSLVARKQGYKFTCKEICFTVGSGKKEKQILKSVSCSMKAGSVLAIIGPSGAGKSTFLNALTMQAFGGTATGEVTLNATKLGIDEFAKYCYTVEQQDHLWAFLTVEETLLYAARLFGCLDPEEEVNEVIGEMGLEVARHTRVGNEFVRGLSGGQKRRLSTAMALLKQPLVLFLDEPTSGLDSTSATEVMKQIVDLSREQNVITICTIHQPPTRVYDTFDLLLLLSTGKDAYFGPANQAMTYFKSIGKDIPTNMNPAEYALDLVNRDFVDAAEVDDTLAKWQKRKPPLVEQREPEKMQKFGLHPPGLMKQMAILTNRQGLLMFRDPTVYVGRAFINMIACCFFALVYWNSRTGDQAQVLNKMWALVSLIGVPCMMAIVGVYGLNAEMLAVKREVRNGMVNPAAFLLVKTVLVLPIIIIFGIMNTGIPAFVIQNIAGEVFFNVLAPYCALLFYFENLAEYLAVQFENYMVGMMWFVTIWFCFFLFGGFLIPEKDMIWPFKAFFYVMPLPYTLRSIVYSHYTTVEWDECPDPTNAYICYSPNQDGLEVLQRAANTYPFIQYEDKRMFNFWIVIAQAMVWKVLFLVVAMYQFSRVAQVGPIPPKEKPVPVPAFSFVGYGATGSEVALNAEEKKRLEEEARKAAENMEKGATENGKPEEKEAPKQSEPEAMPEPEPVPEPEPEPASEHAAENGVEESKQEEATGAVEVTAEEMKAVTAGEN